MATLNYCDSLLESSIQPNCEDPIVKGIEANGLIINRKEIDFGKVEFKAGSKNVIKDLKLVDGAQAYKIHVPTSAPFTGTTTTLEEGTNRKTFTNSVGFVILDNGPEVTQVIDSLSNGEFVIVYENKYKGLQKGDKSGDTAFQIVGYYQGLKAATLENDKYSDDTEGGWNVVLTETKAPKSALFYSTGSYADTKIAFGKLTDVQQP